MDNKIKCFEFNEFPNLYNSVYSRFVDWNSVQQLEQRSSCSFESALLALRGLKSACHFSVQHQMD